MEDKFTYTKAISKIREMTSRVKVVQGGTSAGKTFALLAILIDKATKTSNLEISVVSESVPHIRRGALKDFLKIMKSTNRFNPDNYNKSHLKYTFSNDSYIEFFSVDDESKIRGARRNILYVNEANNIRYDAYLQLSIRTNQDIYIDFNPVCRFWAHDEVMNEEHSEFLILTYLDNEALEQTIIDQLEHNRIKGITSDYWRNWCDVYLDGKIGSLEGVIFNNWTGIDYVPEEATLVGYGMDFGYTNDPSTLIGIYKYNENIILDEVFFRKGLSNADMSALINQDNVKGEIFADSADPKSIAELKKYGHNIKAAKKGKDSIIFGISILQEYDMLVTKRSNNLKEELSRYSWKKDKEGITTNSPEDLNNHAIDAARYLAMMKLSKKPRGKVRVIRR